MTPVQILIATLLLQMGFFSLVWFCLAWLRIARQAAMHWGIVTLLLAASMTLIVERAELDPWVGRLLPNALNLLAFALARRGIQVFARCHPSDLEHALVVLLGAGGAALAVAGVGGGALLVFCANAGMAWSLLRSGADAVRGLAREFGPSAAWACSAPLWAVGVLLALRAVMPLWTADHGSRPLDAAGGFNVLLMFVFIAMGLVLNASLGAMVVLRLVRRLQHLSQHDALTGVLNRRGLEAVLRAEHERLRRHGRAFAMVSVDADHFKRVNDQHGHAAGDAVLVGLAETLRRTSRALDHVGRMGGEEFCVVLPEADVPAAQAAAERLLAAVRGQAFATPGGALHVTVSLGIVVASNPEEDLASLWRRVDAALYAAKEAGRDRAVTDLGRVSAPALAPA